MGGAYWGCGSRVSVALDERINSMRTAPTPMPVRVVGMTTHIERGVPGKSTRCDEHIDQSALSILIVLWIAGREYIGAKCVLY